MMVDGLTKALGHDKHGASIEQLGLEDIKSRRKENRLMGLHDALEKSYLT